MGKAQDVSNFRRNRKLNLIKVLGGKCQICGFDLFPAALEFHHEDPNEKDFGIASKGTCHDLETDLAEIRKCYLLCANCHRGVHVGYYSNPSEHVFDENIANKLRQDKIEKYTKNENHCIDCGVIIDISATRCAKCYAIAERKVKNRPNREELKLLIRTQPFTVIGRTYGVDSNTIKKWCDKVNLPRLKSEIKQYSDEEWEQV